ncbi:energy transducer TonB [Chitinimonas sp.]|uniref:energy transducer TonB n=1 Tax=Chitinimonas sp. TaxID=1934313 RepID=UPI0035B4D7EC
MSFPNLQAIYKRTKAGDGELAAPSNGLSINQRKLLQWSDGETLLSEMAERLAAGHTVDVGRVARDIERLQAMGLLVSADGVSADRPANAMLGQQFGRKSRLPLILGGLGVVAVAGGLFALLGKSPAPHSQLVVAGNTNAGAAAPAAEEEEPKLLGVMPNPARWFAPAAPKPAEPVKAETKADAKQADAKQSANKPAAPAALAPAAAVPQAVAAAPNTQAPQAATTTAAPAASTVQPAANKPAAPTPAPSAPPVAASAPAAPTVVASKPAEAAPPPNTKPIFSFHPDFPSEAVRNGIESGVVKARMTVDEKGQVVRVEVVDAKPKQVFDKAVVAALSKWRFNPAASRFVVETEIDFRAD